MASSFQPGPNGSAPRSSGSLSSSTNGASYEEVSSFPNTLDATKALRATLPVRERASSLNPSNGGCTTISSEFTKTHLSGQHSSRSDDHFDRLRSSPISNRVSNEDNESTTPVPNQRFDPYKRAYDSTRQKIRPGQQPTRQKTGNTKSFSISNSDPPMWRFNTRGLQQISGRIYSSLDSLLTSTKDLGKDVSEIKKIAEDYRDVPQAEQLRVRDEIGWSVSTIKAHLNRMDGFVHISVDLLGGVRVSIRETVKMLEDGPNGTSMDEADEQARREGEADLECGMGEGRDDGDESEEEYQLRKREMKEKAEQGKELNLVSAMEEPGADDERSSSLESERGGDTTEDEEVL